MSRPRNGQQRRKQIVNALHSLLGVRGYDGASVQMIADEARLAQGLVHYHFGTKEQILLAVVAQLVDGLHARMTERLAAATDQGPWAQLDAWIDAHLALGPGSDPASVAAWVAIGSEALRKPSVRAAYEDCVRADLAVADELVTAALASEGRSGDAHTIASGLLAAIEGSYRLASAAPSALPAGFAAPTVRAMARGLIRCSDD